MAKLRPLKPDSVHREPWDRLPHETPVSYGQFRAFLSLEPEERTFENAWQLWKKEHRPNDERKCPGWFRTRGHDYDWRMRADAFDAAQNRKIEAQLRAKKVKAMVATAELGASLREKAAEALKQFEALGLSAGEIAKMASVGVELEQLALGGATHRTEHVGNVTITPGTDVSLANAKDELNRKLDDMKERFEEVQQRMASIGLPPADAPVRLLQPPNETAA